MKNNNLLLIGGAGLLAFLFLRSKAKSGKRGFVFAEATQTVAPGSEEWTNTPDAVIDADKQRLPVQDAVNLAREVIDKVKDGLVVIKSGKKRLALRKGKKRLSAQQLKGKRVKPVKLTRRTRVKLKKQFSPKNVANLTSLAF